MKKSQPEIEMTIDSIRVAQKVDKDNHVVLGNDTSSPIDPYVRVLMLKERKGDRYLPIWIGPSEANNIVVKLQSTLIQRPLTHDFIISIVNFTGMVLKNVVISDIKDDCFYAITRLECDGQLIEIDCRPSDAVAVAIRANAPIYATEKVLGKSSVTPDDFTISEK